MTDLKTETRGRPANHTGGAYVAAYKVTLDLDTHAFLAQAGQGNVSAGIRKISALLSDLLHEVKK